MEQDVSAAEAQVRETKSGFYPALDLVFSQSWNKNLDGLEGPNKDYSAMLRLRYNLFNGGADLARKRQAAYVLDETRDQANRTRRQVVESVRLSWNAYRALNDQMGWLKQHADSSLKTRDAYDKQFGIGQRTLLDLLDSENELFQARSAYVRAQYDRLFAEYRILAGTGDLLQQLNVAVR